MKILILAVFITTISTNLLFSNNRSDYFEDSLLVKIEKTENINDSILIYLELIRFYQSNNLSLSLKYCDIAIDKCINNRLKDLEIEVLIEKSRSLTKSQLFNESKELHKYIEGELIKLNRDDLWGKYYLSKSLKNILEEDFTIGMKNALKALTFLKSTNDSLNIASAYNQIGVLYNNINNYEKALENYLTSKDYTPATNNYGLLTYLNNNIGVIYSKMGDNKTALKYFYKTLEYYNNRSDKNGISIAYNNIALILVAQKRYQKSIIYYKKSLKVSEASHNIQNTTLTYFNLGNLYEEIGQLDSALVFLKKTLLLVTKNNDIIGKAECLIKLGDIHYLLKEYNKALKLFNSSLIFSNEAKILSFQETALKSISKIQFKIGNYKSAYKYQDKAYTITDSIGKLKKQENLQITSLQIDFQNQLNKYKNEINKINNNHTIELNKEKRIKQVFILLLILIILISLYLFYISKKLKHSQVLLNKALDSKDKFFNIIAHDLKNPFNAIIGLTSIINEDFNKISQSDLKQYIELISQSTTNVYNLLENLLEWSRAQTGSINVKPTKFHINDIVIENINLFKQSINKKDITLNYSENSKLYVTADKNMILTVIRNLLSNAIKYTKKNGIIEISIVKLKSFIKVTISDNGVGIKPKNIDCLFKIDKPVTTLGAEKEKGTGLGLLICSEFITLNGGSIEVTSEWGKGSSFSFTIPTS